MIISCAGTHEEITEVQKEILDEGLELLEHRVIKFGENELWVITFEYEGKVI